MLDFGLEDLLRRPGCRDLGPSIAAHKPDVQKHAQVFRWVLILSAAILFPLAFAVPTPAQTSASGSTTTSKSTAPSSEARSTTTHKHPHRRRPKSAKKTTQNVVAPPPPPPPVPPAEQQPRPAKVTFVEGKLSVDANNASLTQILNQISKQTGMVVQGLDHDARIYGQYGPDGVSETLSALLNGTGYNYVIISGSTDHDPATLQLTSANATGSSSSPPIAAGANGASDPQSAAPANGSDPTHVKTPQEIFDELRRAHPP